MLGEHGLGMELQPDHGMARVRDRHDLAVLGGRGDSQFLGQSLARDHERVIPSRPERIGQPSEDAAAVVPDLGSFAVHRPRRPHDRGAVRRCNALVPETHTEDRRRGPKPPDHLSRDPRFGGRARTRRDDDVRRPERRDLLQRRGVVAPHDGFLPQLAYVARQVVDERVVVVDQQDHGASAAIQPRALSSVSAYSCSGSESATIPPPA